MRLLKFETHYGRLFLIFQGDTFTCVFLFFGGKHKLQAGWFFFCVVGFSPVIRCSKARRSCAGIVVVAFLAKQPCLG